MGVFAAFALSACTQVWETNYDQNPSAEQSKGWRLNTVSVDVPRTLTVTEANTFSAEADIVWRGELPGDRYAQVERIMREAIEKGAAGLRNRGRAVDLRVTVTRFHAVTDRTRRQLSAAGVHNINFAIQVVDARSGAVLAAEPDVSADLVAFSGQQALDAEAAGQTQRVRIVNHVANVIAGWLGTGPDVRQSFSRVGI
ncbi:DUF6778 family protein [uncultured Tateyamaria sp.]|uniref:DUF6778 family protein n=1 Tax=uncultured Tateyamaria sp. TaxID=455651 RepID=UPI002625219C|nr:DUF6778 family protein [uncultured Tateyamaria sp.]